MYHLDVIFLIQLIFLVWCYLTHRCLTLIPLYRNWIIGAKMLCKVVRKYLSEKGMCSWLHTQSWFLYISISFSMHSSMYFYMFSRCAAVATSSPCSPWQLPGRGSVQCALHSVCSVLHCVFFKHSSFIYRHLIWFFLWWVCTNVFGLFLSKV